KWAVRESHWKLIGTDGRSNMSLHNLADEKPELTNHAKAQPEIVVRLKKLHEAWARDVAPE
ncbi:MAG: sulfatase, partial [Verrucomicrobiota bacterium]